MFIEALEKPDYIDDLINCLISGSQEEKTKIINGRYTEILKIESIVSQYRNRTKVSEISM